jgi:GTP pyrophosphokinase
MKRAEFLQIARAAFAKKDFSRIETATNFAVAKHHGQKRLSGEPYISHPLAVAALLIEWEMDIDSVIAGILHDVAEDTDTDLKEVEETFGRDAAFLVDGVTKVGQARAGRAEITSYLPETKDNLTKLMIATGADVRVLIIKLADRLHNLRTLNHQPPEKQLKKARESLEIFGPLADRLNMGRARVEIEEISFRYLAPERFNKLKKEMTQRLGAAKKKLDIVKKQISDKLTEEKLDFSMDGRVKSIYSLHKKLGKKDSLDEIYDLIALRIIVDDVATCYLVLGLIHELFTPLPGRIKDYIAQPKINGYQSLHTTVQTESGHIVEFQVRTKAMHEFAERGLAASFHYNEQKTEDAYKKGTLAPLPTGLAWIAELQEAATKLGAGETIDFGKLRLDLFSDRIFVYTPKGDIFDLPSGALPLDFAYRVHSDLAAKASGFKINGAMVKFDTPLKSGDVVEILTRKNILPRFDWLKKVVTPHARRKIKLQLSAEKRDASGFTLPSTALKPILENKSTKSEKKSGKTDKATTKKSRAPWHRR